MGKYIFLFFTICIHGCSMHKSINFILDDNTMITINNKKCDRALCQNPHLHDFFNGISFDKLVFQIKTYLDKKDFIECVCYLGGEPLDQEHKDLLYLTSIISTFQPGIEIYAYTGYDYPEDKEKIDLCMTVLKLNDIFVGHYSSTNNIQRWLNHSF